MSTEIQPTSVPTPAPAPVFTFKWWYKGKTTEGNIIKFEGRITAADNFEACDKVERLMRAEHPTIAWMQGKNIEGQGNWKGVTFGPTTQKMKGKVKS